MNKTSTIQEIICRDPYRLFFPTGVIFSAIGVLPWLFYTAGWIEGYSGFVHSATQTLAYLGCFITGFLMTFIPRFSETDYARKGEVAGAFSLLTAIMIFLNTGRTIPAEICYLGLLVVLIFFIVRRLLTSKSDKRKTFPAGMIWLPAAFVCGITGTVALILGKTGFLPGGALILGKPMMEQGFLLAVVIGIGSFLIPRLSGTFQKQRNSLLFQCVMILIFLTSFPVEAYHRTSLAYGLRAFVISAVYGYTRALVFPVDRKEPYIYLAWFSAWMVAGGYWGAALFPDYNVEALHAAFIGGFGLMVFSIATMVSMSHAGEAKKLAGPLWPLKVTAVIIILAMAVRLATGLFPDRYFQLLATAAALWTFGAGIWFFWAFPFFLKVPDTKISEREMAERRRRLLEEK